MSKAVSVSCKSTEHRHIYLVLILSSHYPLIYAYVPSHSTVLSFLDKLLGAFSSVSPKLARYLPRCVTFSKKLIHDIAYNIYFRSGRKIAKNDYELLRVSSRVGLLGPHCTYFHEIAYLEIFRKLSRKFKFPYHLKRIMDTLHEDLWAFMIASCWILLRKITFSDKSCTENQNTHFIFNTFFPKIVPFIR